MMSPRKKFASVLIQMNRSYKEFGQREVDELRKDLAYITAYPVTEIKKEKWWDGCVSYQADIPLAGASILIATYKLKDNSEFKHLEEMEELHDFLKKHSVTSISSYDVQNMGELGSYFQRRLQEHSVV